MKNKVFIIAFFIGSFLIFLILPLFNYSNDQWRVLHSDFNTYYKGLEPNKSYLKTKYLINNKKQYDTLLMGSSRITNLDANKFNLNSYNMTISLGHIKTHLDILNTLLDNEIKINKIILGVDDAYIFKNPQDFEKDYLRKPYKSNLFDKIEFYQFYLFKKPIKRDFDLFLNKINLIDSEQIVNPNNMTLLINKEKNILKNNLNHIEKISKMDPILLGYKEKFRTEEVLSEIKKFKKICDKNDIKLIIYFNPMYYTTYLSYNQNEIERFKKGLVDIMPFYDFYFLDLHSINEVKWFDTSHFVPSIGDIIFNKIQNNDNYISKSNIDKHILNVRKDNQIILDKKISKIFKFNYNINFTSLKSIFNLNNSNLKFYKNNHFNLKDINDSIEMNVINNDPIIILNNTKSNSENVILSYQIESPVDNIFQLFYKEKKSSNYNENDSYKVAITKGLNSFNLLIPSKYINNGLRVDLVSTKGKYIIRNLKIYDKK